MKNINGKLVGILGTVIIHLIAAIIFMSFKMYSLQKDYLKEITVELAQTEVTEDDKKLIELPVSSVESILQGDEEMLNIARNLANKSEEKIDPADYIDKVKEELIRDGKLGPDNYIDKQKKSEQMNEDEKLALENTEMPGEEEKPKESQEMAANYKGPTRIYYNLADRNHTYLPIPIYKCQGSGKVVLEIQVNQKGVVEEAQIIAEVSSTADPCLRETAVNTALISRFNPDLNSPKLQKGTLTYEFVAQ
jgi:hypothetical protein